MSIFKRLFKLLQSESHAAVDKLEDPVKLTQQGVRDLKINLQKSLQALAEAKASFVTTRRRQQELEQLANDYERKAMLILQKGQKNELSLEKSDQLASQALEQKQAVLTQASEIKTSLDRQQTTITQLETSVKKLRSQIANWEHELTLLKSGMASQ